MPEKEEDDDICMYKGTIAERSVIKYLYREDFIKEEEEEKDETYEWCECCVCGKEITDDTNTKIVCGKDIGCDDESECVVCLECYEDKEEE